MLAVLCVKKVFIINVVLFPEVDIKAIYNKRKIEHKTTTEKGKHVLNKFLSFIAKDICFDHKKNCDYKTDYEHSNMHSKTEHFIFSHTRIFLDEL